MSSNAKQTKAIRARKAKPNRKNLKKNEKRMLENAEALKRLAAESAS